MSDIPVSDHESSDRRTNLRGGAERRANDRPRLGRFRFSDAASLISPRVVTGAARLLEFLLIAGLGYAIFYIYVDQPGPFRQMFYAVAVILTATASILGFQSFQLYDITVLSNTFRQVARIATAWTLVFALLMAMALNHHSKPIDPPGSIPCDWFATCGKRGVHVPQA